jgi:sulfate/thiosulfate transport system substrate-binding protein
MTRKQLQCHRLVILLLMFSICGCGGTDSSTSTNSKPAVTLLNVSYDPTREFYAEFNQSFAEYWQQHQQQTVTIEQSHGGSGKQSRAIIDGLEADVTTLALAYDIDSIAAKDLIDKAWQQRLPSNSAPYTSTIVFLVRKGNPKGIKDWDDLIKPDVKIITASPKTGGGARWNYLAAWGMILKRELGDWSKLNDTAAVAAAEVKAREFLVKLYRQVEVLDPAARAATNTFIQRQIGDLLISWENEAFLAINALGKGEYEVVVPSISIRAEPPVAVVDRVVDKRGTRAVAEAYLQHLYSPQGQQLAAKHYYRPAKPDVISAAQRDQFVKTELFTIDQVFGGWEKAQARHFADGGEFDQIIKQANK